MYKASSTFILSIALLLMLSLFGGCPWRVEQEGWVEGGNPSDPLFQVTYDSSSIFQQPIPDNPEIDPRSDTMVQRLASTVSNEENILLTTQAYTYPVYFADTTTPTYNVSLTASWRPRVNGQRVSRMVNVPIPDGARPDPVPMGPPDWGDDHIVIIDTASGYEYDFWLMSYENDGWTAGWGNRISYTGDGVYPGGYSTRGSGFASAAGLIWPEEIQNGRITHKLFCSFPPETTAGGGPVPPASESDGESNHGDAIPEGAVLQLDPTLDIDDPALGLTPVEKIIAKAMQEYGLILGDMNDGRSITIYTVHPFSFRNNPYPELMQNEAAWSGYVYFRNIPVDRLRVLKLPDQFEPVFFLEDESIYE